MPMLTAHVPPSGSQRSAHAAPHASGELLLFINRGHSVSIGFAVISEEVLHVIVDKRRRVVCVEAAYAKGLLAEQVFVSVAGDVPPLVPYGFVLQ